MCVIMINHLSVATIPSLRHVFVRCGDLCPLGPQPSPSLSAEL